MELEPELREYVDQASRQKEEVARLSRHLTEDQFGWRPEPDRWSVGEHLDHLPRTTRPYLRAIDTAVTAARAEGRVGDGPYRHGWLGDLFVRLMEPPPTFRIGTMKGLEPEPGEPKSRVVDRFFRVQDEVIESLRSANGVDLGRAKLRSPFFKLVKLSIGQAYRVVLAHNRRHLWHARRVLGEPGLPSGKTRADGAGTTGS